VNRHKFATTRGPARPIAAVPRYGKTSAFVESPGFPACRDVGQELALFPILRDAPN